MCHRINYEGKCQKHPKDICSVRSLGSWQRLVTLQVLVGSASPWKILLVIIRHSYTFLKFPDPVSNDEGIRVDMIKLRYAIEKELSKVALRETRSVLEFFFARQAITPESLVLAEFSDEIRLVFTAMYSPVFIVAKNVFTVLSVHWSPLTFLLTISISKTFNQIIGVRAISCPGGVGRWAIFAKTLASCPNFYETVEKKRGWSTNMNLSYELIKYVKRNNYIDGQLYLCSFRRPNICMVRLYHCCLQSWHIPFQTLIHSRLEIPHTSNVVPCNIVPNNYNYLHAYQDMIPFKITRTSRRASYSLVRIWLALPCLLQLIFSRMGEVISFMAFLLTWFLVQILDHMQSDNQQ